jgi:hypothetical protein
MSTALAKGWTPADIAAYRCDPPLQVFVNLIQPVGAVKLIGRETEATQDANEQEREPELQPPPNGLGEHGVGVVQITT